MTWWQWALWLAAVVAILAADLVLNVVFIKWAASL